MNRYFVEIEPGELVLDSLWGPTRINIGYRVTVRDYRHESEHGSIRWTSWRPTVKLAAWSATRAVERCERRLRRAINRRAKGAAVSGEYRG